MPRMLFFFFYCVDTLYIDAESVMSVFQSPLFGKKKTKWKHRSSAWTLGMFLIANSVFKYCISTPHPPFLTHEHTTLQLSTSPSTWERFK